MDQARSDSSPANSTFSRSRLTPAAVVLGVALSGFFDGILLHQILQWHHLLSLVQGAPFDDLRVQVFADGAFHVVMYLIALTGILMLWREGAGRAGRGDWRMFYAGLLVGFGGWNVADVVLFHWILGIHHIRVDTDTYLVWDILWLVVLGIVPAVAGWWMRGPPQGSSGAPRSSAAQAVATIGVLIVGGLTTRAPPTEMTAVLFSPDMQAADVMAVVAELGGSWVGADTTGTLAVIKLPPEVSPWRLYKHGALVVGGTGPAGCLNWIRQV